MLLDFELFDSPRCPLSRPSRMHKQEKLCANSWSRPGRLGDNVARWTRTSFSVCYKEVTRTFGEIRANWRSTHLHCVMLFKATCFLYHFLHWVVRLVVRFRFCGRWHLAFAWRMRKAIWSWRKRSVSRMLLSTGFGWTINPFRNTMETKLFCRVLHKT